jgi:hypothetical protein
MQFHICTVKKKNSKARLQHFRISATAASKIQQLEMTRHHYISVLLLLHIPSIEIVVLDLINWLLLIDLFYTVCIWKCIQILKWHDFSIYVLLLVLWNPASLNDTTFGSQCCGWYKLPIVQQAQKNYIKFYNGTTSVLIQLVCSMYEVYIINQI